MCVHLGNYFFLLDIEDTSVSPLPGLFKKSTEGKRLEADLERIFKKGLHIDHLSTTYATSALRQV